MTPALQQKLAAAVAQGAVWSPLRIEVLTALWTQGLSASQIAKLLRHITRNSVIGKVDRLGLNGERRLGPSHPGKVRRMTAPRRTSPKPVLKIAGKGQVFEACKPGNQAKGLPEVEGGLRIIDPGFGGCRWPMGGEGAETRHCCEPRPAGSTYCEAHARMAYNIRTPEQKAADAARAARAREGKRRGRAA